MAEPQAGIEGLNEETVRQMIEDVGRETTQDLVRIFTHEVRERIKRMNAQSGQDGSGAPAWENLCQEAHALKSSALTYGLDGLGNLARELELAVQEGNPDPALLARLLETAEPALQALEAMLAE
jgi:HPt (histidine-containing phosphotransfer) domain-containing protein